MPMSVLQLIYFLEAVEHVLQTQEGNNGSHFRVHLSSPTSLPLRPGLELLLRPSRFPGSQPPPPPWDFCGFSLRSSF